jgi:hypothetical protein
VVNLQLKTWTQFEYLLGLMDATRHLNCAHFNLGSSISLYFTVLGRCMYMSKVSSLDFFLSQISSNLCLLHELSHHQLCSWQKCIDYFY